MLEYTSLNNYGENWTRMKNLMFMMTMMDAHVKLILCFALLDGKNTHKWFTLLWEVHTMLELWHAAYSAGIHVRTCVLCPQEQAAKLPKCYNQRSPILPPSAAHTDTLSLTVECASQLLKTLSGTPLPAWLLQFARPTFSLNKDPLVYVLIRSVRTQT